MGNGAFRVFTQVLVSVGLIFTVAACSKKSGDKGTDTTVTKPVGGQGDGPVVVTNPKGLIAKDISKIGASNSTYIAMWNGSHNGLFTMIYGGVDGNQIRNYFNTRIHHFFTPKEIDGMDTIPNSAKYTGWTNAEDDLLVGASNIGMGIWLQGALDSVTFQIRFDGQWHSVDSSRFGMMSIGPGYFEQYKLKGQVITFPAEYRQAILLHEARHSDCTGGITQKDLDVLRNSTSLKETDAKMTARQCGHLHKLCPAGHELAGAAACDSTPWGPYAVQDVYLSAVSASLSGLDKRIIDADQVDTRSRLLYNTTDLYAGRLGWPDMSSGGIQ